MSRHFFKMPEFVGNNLVSHKAITLDQDTEKAIKQIKDLVAGIFQVTEGELEILGKRSTVIISIAKKTCCYLIHDYITQDAKKIAEAKIYQEITIPDILKLRPNFERNHPGLLEGFQGKISKK